MRWSNWRVVLIGAALLGCKPSSAAPSVEGQSLFASACQRCHGASGGGGLPLWEGGPSPRNFRDHDFQRSITDSQIRDVIVHGKGSGMPPFGTTFDDAKLELLVAQVRSFEGDK